MKKTIDRCNFVNMVQDYSVILLKLDEFFSVIPLPEESGDVVSAFSQLCVSVTDTGVKYEIFERKDGRRMTAEEEDKIIFFVIENCISIPRDGRIVADRRIMGPTAVLFSYNQALKMARAASPNEVRNYTAERYNYSGEFTEPEFVGLVFVRILKILYPWLNLFEDEYTFSYDYNRDLPEIDLEMDGIFPVEYIPPLIKADSFKLEERPWNS